MNIFRPSLNIFVGRFLRNFIFRKRAKRDRDYLMVKRKELLGPPYASSVTH